MDLVVKSTTHPEDPGFNPSTSVVTHSHLQLQFQGIWHTIATSMGATLTWCMRVLC